MHIKTMIDRYPALQDLEAQVRKASETICNMARGDGKLLLCGNGGSCADCEHIAGEMLKGFLLRRTPDEEFAKGLQKGIAALPLPSIVGTLTAVANDNDPADIYAQLTYALGKKGDVFLGISTSGNAKNVCRAAKVAHSMGLPVIALVGKDGGELANLADIAIIAPANETYQIQEYHLPIYHAICAQCEAELFGE